MATRSFTDTDTVKQINVNNLRNIMKDEHKIKMTTVKHQKVIKGKAMLEMLGLTK